MAPLEIFPILNGLFQENCYLLGETGGTDAIIVDPGEEPERFLEEARLRGRTISGIWLTHAHIDHIMGVEAVKRATGAPVHLHPDDRPIYDTLVAQGQLFGFDLTMVATGMLAIADFVPGDVDKEQMIADYDNDQIDVVGRDRKSVV